MPRQLAKQSSVVEVFAAPQHVSCVPCETFVRCRLLFNEKASWSRPIHQIFRTILWFIGLLSYSTPCLFVCIIYYGSFPMDPDMVFFEHTAILTWSCCTHQPIVSSSLILLWLLILWLGLKGDYHVCAASAKTSTSQRPLGGV